MNTYLVPTTAAYCYEPYDYIYLVYADTPHEAYIKARNKLKGEYIPQELLSYESYPFQLYKPNDTATFPFHSSKKYDILTKALKNTRGAEYMSYFQVDWEPYVQKLKEKAASEKWSNSTYTNDGILKNYIAKTHERIVAEKKLAIGKNYAVFNTGLFTEYDEVIYAYQKNSTIQFYNGYDLNLLGVKERPERADYFKKPELLLFDWHYPIDIQYQHILEDEENRSRLPAEFFKRGNVVSNLSGSIETMKKKVSANYRLAVPQFYKGRIQLLLPLCLLSDKKPDVAIVVTKKDTCYQGHTCLSLDMAYNNARLIAKPEATWLLS